MAAAAAELVYNSLVFLLSPLFSLMPFASEPSSTKSKEIHVATTVQGGGGVLMRLFLGLVAATYVCLVLLVAMLLAMVLGVGLVQMWVEEPVIMRQSVFFDYTEVHPEAVFSLVRGGDGGGLVPVGHTFYVYLELSMPESEFNREIGVFQLTAQLISDNGRVILKSSQPCLLRFTSLPVRVVRTFVMLAPLLLGISSEAQTMRIDMLRHKEGHPRTEAIRIAMIPRAGTTSVPQIYEAEIVLNSQLPWKKELVRRWKLTCCVWMSFVVYAMLLMILLCCFRPLVFPNLSAAVSEDGIPCRSMEASEEESQEKRKLKEEWVERGISETVRRWQQSRRRRKAMLKQATFPEITGSSASSMTLAMEETRTNHEEDNGGDSESVCSRV